MVIIREDRMLIKV